VAELGRPFMMVQKLRFSQILPSTWPD